MKDFITKNSKYVAAFSVLVAVLIGWYSHFYYIVHIQDRTAEVRQIRENSSDYHFINPLILVADGRDIQFAEYTDLKNQLEQYIKEEKSKGNVKDVSFYLKNLNGSEWLGIGENDLYSPASMLKVSVLMAYLKLADSNPEIMKSSIYYNVSDNAAGQTYKPKALLKSGNYDVKTLLQQMIVNSDNNAMRALDSQNVDEVLKIYHDLSLPDPLQEKLDFMSPRAYSRLFRALYNGAYISHFYSEEALGLLAITNFNEGLVKGVGSTTVSHKFGEITKLGEKDKVDERQLHDCGVVYYPGKPYFICVMTRGQDFSKLSNIIAHISKITFDYMSNANN